MAGTIIILLRHTEVTSCRSGTLRIHTPIALTGMRRTLKVLNSAILRKTTTAITTTKQNNKLNKKQTKNEQTGAV